MTKTWNGPTPFDSLKAETQALHPEAGTHEALTIDRAECARIGFRAAKNDDMAMYEALLSLSRGLLPQDPIRVVLAAYAAGLREGA